MLVGQGTIRLYTNWPSVRGWPPARAATSQRGAKPASARGSWAGGRAERLPAIRFNSAHPLEKVGTVGTDPSMRDFQLAGEKGLVLPVPTVPTFLKGMRRKDAGGRPLVRSEYQEQLIAAMTIARFPSRRHSRSKVDKPFQVGYNVPLLPAWNLAAERDLHTAFCNPARGHRPDLVHSAWRGSCQNRRWRPPAWSARASALT